MKTSTLLNFSVPSALCSLLLLLFLFPVQTTSAQQTGQDSTGLPGDNFSLQGALDLFEKVDSPEAFEKAINDESNHVNNLDLNGDGEIDYVRVMDMMDDNVHVFVLQVPVSEKESQDIAVIELEKTGDESAVLQIVGDEDIYGEEVIFEPSSDDDGKDNRKGAGPSVNPDAVYVGIVVNVWYWPSVRFVYAPAYRPWVSPWRWRSYPTWWRPWRPVTWHVWHPYHHHYRRPYVVAHTHRIVHGPRIYRPARVTSVSVHTRHATSVGHYRVNHKKTTVTGPRGNKTTVRKTTVKGPRGHVKGTRTTVTRRRG